MDWFQTDPKQWAATQFGEANLGDKRRTKRLLHRMALPGIFVTLGRSMKRHTRRV